MAVHSLNALRVMAEFIIVRGHITLLVAAPELIARATFAVITLHDLMTFFFVLSGYVCVHTAQRLGLSFDTWADIRAYWGNKLIRYYPMYIFAILVQHVISGAYIALNENATCGWRWMCTFGDFFLLSPLLFCEVVGTSGVAWYLSTLFWLWFAFPLLSKQLTHQRVWRRVTQLYVLSLIGWLSGFWIRDVDILAPWASLHRFPVLRVAEFYMGCQAFHATPPTGLQMVALVVLYATYLVLGAFASGWYTNCTDAPVIGPCWPMGQVSERVVHSCMHWWDMIHSRASLPFAALIRYVAHLEASASPRVAWLQHDIFKTFNKFSLHVYLLHLNIASSFWWICKKLGMDGVFLLDSAIIVAYLTSYMALLYVQPVLNTIAFTISSCGRPKGERLRCPSAPPPMEPLDTTAVILDTCEANTQVVWVEQEMIPNASDRI